MFSGTRPAFSQDTWLAQYRIELRANPMAIPADGKTKCRIQAEVRRFDGTPAPDGTQVVFNTDLGLLGIGESDRRASVTATTRGGVAIVYLRGETVGVATVYALVEGSRTSLRVTFLEPGAEAVRAAKRPRSLVVSGKWVGFCVEANVIETRGRSRITYGDLVFEVGDVASLDVNTLTLRAVGCIVRRGKASVEAEGVYADLNSTEILVQRMVEEAVIRQRLAADTLSPIESEEPIPPGTFTIPEVQGDMWFVAASIRFFPGEKIVLRGASLYAGAGKVLSLPPYWVIALPGFTGVSNSTMLNVGTSGEVAFDLPFFFQVTDTWTGAVRLQRGTSASSVSARSGWSLALHEEYATVSGTRGALTLTGLPTSQWGFSWRDSRSMFGSSEVFTDFSSPDHRSLFVSTSIYTPRPSYMFSLSASYDKPADYDGSYGATAEWLAYPRPLGRGGRAYYSLGTALSFRRGAGLGQNGESGTVFGHEIYGALDFSSLGLGGSWTVEPRLENVYAYYSDDKQYNTLRGELALVGRLGRPNPVRLVYSAAHYSGDFSEPGWEQELNLYLSALSGRWSSYLSASHSITQDRDVALLSMSYRLTDTWRLGSLLTYY
ncbi:MAG: hypothetical protein N2512_01845, partial [Armatimonadetes bacterium]|nr:hypothetical protein [Armatimonadota bacterium]